MLQVKDIRKEYKTGTLVQKALDGVSVNFRDNEFVAILGPSGSGKTTLLNIVGGLDRYDSGDLIINGVSTKKYKDRDWDSYRNHTIGFVFQSYNLISHQTVLANVELALTISGISGAERKKRAIAALEQVGLGDHIHKKPNQMSGGQMQRVAIARALVNDPDIVLADEPTGALDSETSVQVMNLLKEVAKDRLVIMVTHNPELAAQYATRTVTIKDGHIIGDTNPLIIKEKDMKPAVHKNLGKASMSFLTALALSFNNLKTKKARTFMVSFSGSIGIIGIAMILALSSGVNAYIKNIEQTTLSQYPLQIEKTGYDLSSFMGDAGNTNATQKQDNKEKKDGQVGVNSVADSMFQGVSTNDLGSLKQYFESGKSDIKNYVSSIEYQYNLTPQIYYVDNGKNYKVNPNEMFSSLATGSMDLSSMMSGTMGTSVFHALPKESKLYKPSYSLKAGHWPENSHELVLVLSGRGNVSDILLYQLGIKDRAKLEQMVADFKSGNAATTPVTNEKTDNATYTYDDFLGRTFKLVPSYQYYTYDKQYGIWTDKSTNQEYINELVKNGEELKIVGIVQPNDNSDIKILSSGIAYPYTLITELMEGAAESDIVKAQLADDKKNIFTAKGFDEEDSSGNFDMSKLFQIDENALSSMFQVDKNALDFSNMDFSNMDLGNIDFSKIDMSNIDLSKLDLSKLDMSNIDMSSFDFSGIDMGNMDMSNIDLSNIDMSKFDFSKVDLSGLDMSQLKIEDAIDTNQIISNIQKNIKIVPTENSGEELQKLLQNLLGGYEDYAARNHLVTAAELTTSIGDYLGDVSTQRILADKISQIVTESEVTILSREDVITLIDDILAGYIDYIQETFQNEEITQELLTENLRNYLNSQEVQTRVNQFISSLNGRIRNIFTEEKVSEILTMLGDGYQDRVQNGTAIEPASLVEGFGTYLSDGDTTKLMTESVGKIIQTDVLEQSIMDSVNPVMESMFANIGSQIQNQIQTSLEQMMTTAIGDTMSQAMGQTMNQVMNQIMNQVMPQTMNQVMGQVMSEVTNQMMSQVMGQIMTPVMTQLQNGIASSMNQVMNSLASSLEASMENMFAFDPSKLDGMFNTTIDAKQLQEMMVSMMSGSKSSYESNLAKIGYVDADKPDSILIYSKDFEAKNHITAIIKDYNNQMKKAGEEKKVIVYTDLVATMMTSVTDIINAISYILIAFVGISLVVSSIMIGVITLISVMERRKEIGILRAIGASKRNVGQVFNAETFITGLLAGVIGIIVTEILIIPANAIIRSVADNADIRAQLPIIAAFILILLSIFLTMIAGLLPARKASKSDPVSALRSE